MHVLVLLSLPICYHCIFIAADIGDGKDSALSEDAKIAAYCLLLPGDTLHLTPLLAAKKFRNKGNKDGAIRAFGLLEKDGLGNTYVITGSKGGSTQVCIYAISLRREKLNLTMFFLIYSNTNFQRLQYQMKLRKRHVLARF